MRSFVICDQVKKDEMRRVCSTNGEEQECIQDIGGKASRKTKKYVGG
jgi:hypothetical protein